MVLFKYVNNYSWINLMLTITVGLTFIPIMLDIINYGLIYFKGDKLGGNILGKIIIFSYWESISFGPFTLQKIIIKVFISWNINHYLQRAQWSYKLNQGLK